MDGPTELAPRFARFLLSHAAGRARDRDVHARRLHGGLVSHSVLHVCVRFRGTAGCRSAASFVVKQLGPESEREADIYRILLATGTSGLAPVLLGVDRQPGKATSLYLEAVVASSRWPWSEIGRARRVLEALAELHDRGGGARCPLADDWNYEAELIDRAERTVRQAERMIALTRDGRTRASLPALRRVVAQLPDLRRRLLEGPLPPTLLHGDVHSGNAVIRTRNGREEPVLLDWARARIGSPFEDVSSWLQSLGFWEPAVKRKHDTLLAAYLTRRGVAAPASRDVRDAYWLAAGSNALAGALCYQLERVADALRPGAERSAALRAAHDWLRVIRGADVCLRARG